EHLVLILNISKLTLCSHLAAPPDVSVSLLCPTSPSAGFSPPPAAAARSVRCCLSSTNCFREGSCVQKYVKKHISELEGHTAPVTSVIVVPAAGAACKLLYNCWTSSLDGTLRYWNFASGELIKTVDVSIPIYFMVIPMISILSDKGNKFSSLYAFISVEHTAPISNGSGQQKARKCQVRVVNLTKSRVIEGILTETSEVEPLVVSSSGDFFGTCSVNKLLIWKFPTKDFSPCEVRKLKLHHTKQLTVLAFHPNERIVAGGDITGRILIWRGFGKRTFSQNGSYLNKRVANVDEEEPGVRDNDDADSCSTWHWHPTAVKLLSFSSDGAYLFSGRETSDYGRAFFS
ncbi:WD repeat-containing protein 75, partial [Nymphaea thermarum]